MRVGPRVSRSGVERVSASYEAYAFVSIEEGFARILSAPTTCTRASSHASKPGSSSPPISTRFRGGCSTRPSGRSRFPSLGGGARRGVPPPRGASGGTTEAPEAPAAPAAPAAPSSLSPRRRLSRDELGPTGVDRAPEVDEVLRGRERERVRRAVPSGAAGEVRGLARRSPRAAASAARRSARR